MVKELFPIRNRFTGAVQFNAEIECKKDAALSVKIGLAVKWAINNNARLTDADLTNADLTGARLTDARLTGAKLTRASIIDAGQDARGYRFVGVQHDCGLMIAAGCRWFTLAEALTHWSPQKYDGPRERQIECFNKVALIAAVAEARGWTMEKREAA